MCAVFFLLLSEKGSVRSEQVSRHALLRCQLWCWRHNDTGFHLSSKLEFKRKNLTGTIWNILASQFHFIASISLNVQLWVYEQSLEITWNLSWLFFCSPVEQSCLRNLPNSIKLLPEIKRNILKFKFKYELKFFCVRNLYLVQNIFKQISAQCWLNLIIRFLIVPNLRRRLSNLWVLA